MQSQKDLGFLMNPGEGAISAVALYVPPGASAPTHLFSGGVDGTMAVWSAGRSWDCLKVRLYLMQCRTCCMMPVGCRAMKFKKAYLAHTVGCKAYLFNPEVSLAACQAQYTRTGCCRLTIQLCFKSSCSKYIRDFCSPSMMNFFLFHLYRS